MHEGVISQTLGLKGIPAASEEIMVYREIALARQTGCPVHIAHVSTASSVALVKAAKEEGLSVTAETAPHYFTLDHRAVMRYDGNAKMNPPLRTQADVGAIKQGLAEGVIDIIATDHAPHSKAEKNLSMNQAAFGIIGLQTALPLTLDLVREGIFTIGEAVVKLSYNPARRLQVPGGQLRVGVPADLTIFDAEYEYTLKEEHLISKSKNSPFIGQTLRGIVEMTMVGGEIVWERKAQDSRR